MSEVTGLELLNSRAPPAPDEVMAVVEASGLAGPGLLDVCKIYGIAHRGLEAAQNALTALSHERGWQRGRVERAAQTLANFMSLRDSLDTYLDEIRYALPESALRAVWWQ
jgi:hypothetical protein